LIPHLNSPSTAPRELLGDRGPRKSLPLQLKDLYVIRWRVSRPPRSRSWFALVLRDLIAPPSRWTVPLRGGARFSVP
jgi:hypothetical protein